jgi:hypothetical protein
MDDLFYIGVVMIAFALLGALAWACEALRRQQ